MSNKTELEVSLTLLEQGMRRLHESIATTNNEYLKEVELCTLLTTVVENIHAVSHFKPHETFTALQYFQDFGTITTEESLKRITKWGGGGGKYFTHHTSRTSFQFSISFISMKARLINKSIAFMLLITK